MMQVSGLIVCFVVCLQCSGLFLLPLCPSCIPDQFGTVKRDAPYSDCGFVEPLTENYPLLVDSEPEVQGQDERPSMVLE